MAKRTGHERSRGTTAANIFLSMAALFMLSYLSSFTHNCSAERFRGVMDRVRSIKLSSPAMYKMHLALSQDMESSAISPWSIDTVVRMLYLGSNGKTRMQIEDTYDWSFKPGDNLTEVTFGNFVNDDETRLWRAGNVWIDETRDCQKYEDKLKTSLSFSPQRMNVSDREHRNASRNNINNWICDNTNGKMREMLSERCITPNTKLVLVSAIYFIAKWANEFEKVVTGYPFDSVKQGAGKSEEVERVNNIRYMKAVAKRFSHYDADGKLSSTSQNGYEVFKFPYSREGLSMVIIKPDQPLMLRDFERRWASNPKEIEAAIALTDSRPESMNLPVHLPRFKLTGENLDVIPALREMGLTELADPNRSDLTGINDSFPKIFLNSVRHRCEVEVDEKGTEAAATTVADCGDGPCPKKKFIDCAFMYQIRLENQEGKPDTVLFIGRVGSEEVLTKVD